MPAKRKNFKVYLLSAAFGAAAGGLTLPVFSFLIWFLQLPVELSATFSILAFGSGCLVSGISAGRLKRQGGLISGIKSALFLLLLLAAVTFVTGGFSGEFLLSRLVTAVICGSAGGVIGVNKR